MDDITKPEDREKYGTPYFEIEGLDGIYLEDSFVLEVLEKPESFTFYLEAVLTPKHPDYHPPSPRERHCFKRGMLIFPDVINIEWILRTMDHPAEDVNGELDYGNIHAMYVKKDTYTIFGDFGEIIIRSAPAKFI